MTVTKILGEQSGIQYQGVQDKSEADPRDTLINTYFAGQFKHGPFNKPFKVTRENIRAKLGYDPDNLVYQAIEDCLAQGVPFVWVMRTAKAKVDIDLGVGGAISCAGATDSIYLAMFMDSSKPIDQLQSAMLSMKLQINDQVFSPNEEVPFAGLLKMQELDITNPPDDVLLPSPSGMALSLLSKFTNISSSNVRIKYDCSANNPELLKVFALGNNPAILNSDGLIANACLSPVSAGGEVPEPIKCTPSVVPMLNEKMGVDNLIFKFSVNGGGIYTHEENTDRDATVQTVLVNLLAYGAGFIHQEAAKTLNEVEPRNFLVSYNYPIQGAPAGSGAPMTVELWATPGVDNCIITKAFGGNYVLRSCGAQVWNQSNVLPVPA
ncbi:hypothetical protein [Acinetobacter radioresistens]|uniref:hypothetical protein n=1 Tax=Acinetobacter radioresistens TaxID=40216 RepID=UPI002004733C|nr:hypothetical protein [Acinetobacter radioresistens]